MGQRVLSNDLCVPKSRVVSHGVLRWVWRTGVAEVGLGAGVLRSPYPRPRGAAQLHSGQHVCAMRVMTLELLAFPALSYAGI